MVKLNKLGIVDTWNKSTLISEISDIFLIKRRGKIQICNVINENHNTLLGIWRDLKLTATSSQRSKKSVERQILLIILISSLYSVYLDSDIILAP